MALVIQRPTRGLLEQAAEQLWVYGFLRQNLGRKKAFLEWCDILGLDPTETAQLAHVRIKLLQDLAAGDLNYDDIDWSGTDENRRASSTGTEFVDTLEGWFDEDCRQSGDSGADEARGGAQHPAREDG